ncbi:MAG: hypothetical protein ACREKS_00180 [Candidatus Rokuibacteriota bacterium]
MCTLIERRVPGAQDQHVLALNYATLRFADEILWLPSQAVAIRAVTLLYGTEIELPESLFAHVGRGMPASAARLLVRSAPLATLLPSRLGTAWRVVAGDLKASRALARRRYRELQTSLMIGERISSSGADSLVRHTYGTRGRWNWTEAARRILEDVVVLNRAALALLIAHPRSLSPAPLEDLPPLSDRAEATLAEALPPVVVPDFGCLAEGLTRGAPVLDGEESIERYQSLFAEMLSFAGHHGEVHP